MGLHSADRFRCGPDGEHLVLGKYAGPLPKGITSLGHCVACHGNTANWRLFANFGDASGGTSMSWTDQVKKIIAQKEASTHFKAYQAERK